MGINRAAISSAAVGLAVLFAAWGMNALWGQASSPTRSALPQRSTAGLQLDPLTPALPDIGVDTRASSESLQPSSGEPHGEAGAPPARPHPSRVTPLSDLRRIERLETYLSHPEVNPRGIELSSEEKAELQEIVWSWRHEFGLAQNQMIDEYDRVGYELALSGGGGLAGMDESRAKEMGAQLVRIHMAGHETAQDVWVFPDATAQLSDSIAASKSILENAHQDIVQFFASR